MLNQNQLKQLAFVLAGSAFLSGAGFGFAVGFKRGAKKAALRFGVSTGLDQTKDEIQNELQKQLEEIRARRQQKVVIPEAVANAEPVVQPDSDGSGEETEDIFAQTGPDWDYTAELAIRDSAIPYVIHVEEFYEESARPFQRSFLTYYKGDDRLADEHNMVLYNRADIVGDNLHRFGHGSGNPSIVYIRNEVLEIDYEVVVEERFHNADDEDDEPSGSLQHGVAPRRFRLKE